MRIPFLQKLKDYLLLKWQQSPLQSILILALVLRLLAAVFSQGYGMHDDHFIAVEEPWSWTQGRDYDGWLPGTKGEASVPSIYSFFYPGINYLLFEGMHALGIMNPKAKMFLIRLLLGLFSLLTVYFGYQITKHYSSEKIAKQTGLLLAVFWFMPFFGVRNLVEVVAIPLLLGSTWLILKTNYLQEKDKSFLFAFFMAGLLAGLSLSVRFQAGVYVAGMGLVLLIQKRFLSAVVFGLGTILSFGVLQAVPDYLIWGKPFSVLEGYIQYNLANKGAYGNQDNVLMYFQLIPGLLIPPIGLFLFFGFFLKVKNHLLVFLPSLLFLLFHTWFPNRQERFILTIVPMVIMLGVIGWDHFYNQSEWWATRNRLYKNFNRFFWIVNTVLLLAITFTYSKRSRVEAMHYFYKAEKAINTVIIDDTGRRETMMMPVFYAGKAFNTLTISNYDSANMHIYYPWSYIQVSHSREVLRRPGLVAPPQYIVFVEDINLENRVRIMQAIYPSLAFEAYIKPSLTDKIMKKLNPKNKNEDFYIYTTGL